MFCNLCFHVLYVDVLQLNKKGKNNCNWLEFYCLFEQPWDNISCDLVLNKNCNLIEIQFPVFIMTISIYLGPLWQLYTLQSPNAVTGEPKPCLIYLKLLLNVTIAVAHKSFAAHNSLYQNNVKFTLWQLIVLDFFELPELYESFCNFRGKHQLGWLLQRQLSQLHVTELTELATQTALVFAVSVASALEWSHQGVTLWGLWSRLHMYSLWHLLLPAVRSANTASTSTLSSGTPTHCCTHTQSACITSELK